MLGATAALGLLRRTVPVRVAAFLPAKDELTGKWRKAINNQTLSAAAWGRAEVLTVKTYCLYSEQSLSSAVEHSPNFLKGSKALALFAWLQNKAVHMRSWVKI